MSKRLSRKKVTELLLRSDEMEPDEQRRFLEKHGIKTVDADAIPFTTEAEGLFEHMRRCGDCTDAVLDWARPMFEQMGAPDGRIRRDFAGFKKAMALNHDFVDFAVHMFVKDLQLTGRLRSYLDRVARIAREQRALLVLSKVSDDDEPSA